MVQVGKAYYQQYIHIFIESKRIIADNIDLCHCCRFVIQCKYSKVWIQILHSVKVKH